MSAVASETAKPVHEQGTTPAPARLTSLDAYRGLVMLLMMAEALDLSRVAQAVPGSALWNSWPTTKVTPNGLAARSTT